MHRCAIINVDFWPCLVLPHLIIRLLGLCKVVVTSFHMLMLSVILLYTIIMQRVKQILTFFIFSCVGVRKMKKMTFSVYNPKKCW